MTQNNNIMINSRNRALANVKSIKQAEHYSERHLVYIPSLVYQSVIKM